MTYIADTLRRQVEQRAAYRCEYCRIREENSYFAHEIDHIYAEKHGGATEIANLCLACSNCNRYKGSDLCSLDLETGELVALYHPRRQNREAHFRLMSDGEIQAYTSQARVTIRILRMNSIEQRSERQRGIDLGIWDE